MHTMHISQPRKATAAYWERTEAHAQLIEVSTSLAAEARRECESLVAAAFQSEDIKAVQLLSRAAAAS